MISLASKNEIFPVYGVDTRTCFIKKLPLIISNSQENAFVRVFFYLSCKPDFIEKDTTTSGVL